MSVIYALVDTKHNLVGYVGQATYPEARFQEHINEAYPIKPAASWETYSSPITYCKQTWLAYLLSCGIPLEMQILEDGLEKGHETDARENYWIAEMTRLGHPLTNERIPRELFEKMGIERFQADPNCPYLKMKKEKTGMGLDLSLRAPSGLYAD